MVFPEREGLKELEGKREREELWDLQEDRESKASRVKGDIGPEGIKGEKGK